MHQSGRQVANCASEQGCDEKGPVLQSLKHEVSYFGVCVYCAEVELCYLVMQAHVYETLVGHINPLIAG